MHTMISAGTTDPLQLRSSTGNRAFRRSMALARDRAVPVFRRAGRHSFATRLLERSVDIRSAQRALGHAGLSTTERYVHVQDHKLVESIRVAREGHHPPVSDEVAARVRKIVREEIERSKAAA